MKYGLVKKTVDLVEQFEFANINNDYPDTVAGFKRWIADNQAKSANIDIPEWEGKDKGRSPESVISTLLVHMSRFAKSYSRAAIAGSAFSTQEDFIYLINLKAFGEMTKMDLIKKNVHEKSAGILIISRLINNGWVVQQDSSTDKRTKIIKITNHGIEVLEQQMDKIREATKIVCGDLSETEKMQLINLLNKLNEFHIPIYNKSNSVEKLLDEAISFKAQREYSLTEEEK